MRGMGRNTFVERYRKWCKRYGYNFTAAKAEEIHTEAKELIAMLPKNSLSKVMVQEAITQLNTVAKTVEVFRAEMNQLAQELPEYKVVMSLYGAGSSLGLQLIAEIGDVRRFSHKGSLTAFAGVDPGANQSGTFEAKSTRSSKRGFPELRKTLFVLMTVLLQKAPTEDPVFQFLDKKRAEGKPYHVYMTAGCNKFLRIYYGKVKEFMNTLDTPVDTDSTGLSR